MAPTSLGERWAAAWSAHDPEALGELFAEDCDYEDVAFAVVNQGREGVLAWARSFLASFPDLVVEPRSSFEGGGHAVLEWEMSGTQRGEFDGLEPGDQPFRVRGVTVFSFEDERISRCSDYWNLGDVRRQLGA